MIKPNQKTSQVVVLVGFIYGAGSSTYFLAWHIFAEVSHRPFPLSLFRNELAFLGWAIVHSSWYFLAFQEREATNVRWGSLVGVNPGIEEFSRAVVALCVWYFCIVLLWQIMIPLIREHSAPPGRAFELVLTSLLLVQTVYLAVFFLVGKERLFSKNFLALFDPVSAVIRLFHVNGQ